MTDEPESLILQLLRNMRAELADVREQMATKDEMADLRARTATREEIVDLRSEMNSFRADVASDFLTTRKDFAEKIVGLRRAVIEYHTSTIGHGIFSELEARL